MTNCHTRGDGVRIDDDVGGDSLAAEGHVLLPVLNATGACNLIQLIFLLLNFPLIIYA